MPDIEAMELVERFFRLGKRVVGSPNPIAIFLAGCRECRLRGTGRGGQRGESTPARRAWGLRFATFPPALPLAVLEAPSRCQRQLALAARLSRGPLDR